MGVRKLSLRNALLVGSAVLATSAYIAAAPATADPFPVIKLATVPGKIFDTDGQRVLYAPTDALNQVRILNLTSTTTTTVSVDSTLMTSAGYLTPLGAVFSAGIPSASGYPLQSYVTDGSRIYNYNGGLTQIAFSSGDRDFKAAGPYAVFSGKVDTPTDQAPWLDYAYRLDTRTNALTVLPMTDQYAAPDDVSTQGLVVASSLSGQTSSIVTFDGTTAHEVLSHPYPAYALQNVLTDGSNLIYERSRSIQPSGQTCCVWSTDLVYYDSKTGTEQVLQANMNDASGHLSPERDYQIANGWVLYHGSDAKSTYLKSPSGTTTQVENSSTIVKLSSQGDYVFMVDHSEPDPPPAQSQTLSLDLYLHDLEGNTVLVSESIYSVFHVNQVPISPSYENATKIGYRWYFYGNGMVGEMATQIVPMDDLFNSDPSLFNADTGTKFIGVGDFTVTRPIWLDAPTIFDTKGYTVTLAADLAGDGYSFSSSQLEKRGAGTLIVTGWASYAGSTTTISEGTLQFGDGTTYGTSVVDIGHRHLITPDAFIDNSRLVFDLPAGVHTRINSLTGTGTLEQIGKGVVELAGPATLTGGIKIANGSSMLISYGGTTVTESGSWLHPIITYTHAVIPADFINDGLLNFYRTTSNRYPDETEISGEISGTGQLTTSGNSTLVLTGTNTYTGLTTIDSATNTSSLRSILQIGDGGTTGSIIGDVKNYGAIAFDRSDTMTFAGVVSGTGSLRQRGTGTLVLTGANTYTGGTTINSGTLQLGNNGTTGSVTGDVLDTGTLVFKRSDTVAFSGAISGTGAVRQAGTGTVILNADNTYTGGTVVDSGTLMIGDAAHPGAYMRGPVTVASGATLSGHGTINGPVTNNGGTVSPGGSIGTLTLASYTQGASSTLNIEVTPAGNSSLHVLGAATLGGTLQFDFAPGSSSTQKFSFLTAASITGQFSAVTASGPAPDLFYGFDYSTTGVSVAVQTTPAAQIFSDLVTAAIGRAHEFTTELRDHDSQGGCTTSCPHWTIWGHGLAGASAVDAKTLDANDFSTRWAGLVVGVTYHFDTGADIGLAASYTQHTLASGSSTALTNAVGVALTLGMPLLDGRLSGAVSYLSDFTESHRDLGSFGVAVAHPDDGAIGGYLQYSHPIGSGDVSPYVGLDIVQARHEATRESGADSFDLAQNARVYSSMFAEVGLHFIHRFAVTDGMALIPTARAGIGYDLEATKYGTEIGPNDQASPQKIIFGAAADRTVFKGGLALALEAAPATTFSFGGQGQMGGHSRAASVRLGARVQF